MPSSILVRNISYATQGQENNFWNYLYKVYFFFLLPLVPVVVAARSKM
jgi:hypothetical protein